MDAKNKIPKGPPGKRCYAIGDVHGRLDLLTDILQRIETDNAARAPKEVFIVFLGDLIDRGPDSKGVIELLHGAAPSFAKCLSLMGNHEEALVRGMRGEADILPAWLSNGGYECAQSYGAPVGQFVGASGPEIHSILSAYIPKAHLDFLASMHNSVQFGDYLLVHAGIRPGMPLDRMGSDLRWIRDEFLRSTERFDWIVVHGHTISEAVDMRPNRIGIDTGAYKTGVLTALRIEDEVQSVLQTAP